MAHLIWTHDLDTGIDVIDHQHRQIMDFINHLHDATAGGDRTAIGGIIDGLVDYTLSHFAFEETLMEDSGYEFFRPHKKVHDIFVRRVAEMQTRFKDGENVTDELHRLLSRWLFSHIRSEDAAFARSAKKNMPDQAYATKETTGWFSRAIGRFFGRG